MFSIWPFTNINDTVGKISLFCDCVAFLGLHDYSDVRLLGIEILLMLDTECPLIMSSTASHTSQISPARWATHFYLLDYVTSRSEKLGFEVFFLKMLDHISLRTLILRNHKKSPLIMSSTASHTDPSLLRLFFRKMLGLNFPPHLNLEK